MRAKQFSSLDFAEYLGIASVWWLAEPRVSSNARTLPRTLLSSHSTQSRRPPSLSDLGGGGWGGVVGNFYLTVN